MASPLIRQTDSPTDRLHADRIPWKVAVIDDEPNVHTVTTLVLRRFTFDGRPVEFVSAYSAREARELLQTHRDVAVALVDVVMEEDDAGLKLIRWVREELQNTVMRLVVRTGQPALAPEDDVIQRYEVNDYRLKTDLTDTKLRTTLSTALRNYRDLVTVERSRYALERMVEGAASIWQTHDLHAFVQSVLGSATTILLSEGGDVRSCSAFAVRKGLDSYQVLGGTGSYRELQGQDAESALPAAAYEVFNEALETGEPLTRPGWFASSIPVSNGERGVFVVEYPEEIQPIEHKILSAYATTVRLAADNLYLSQRMERAQRDMLFFLGEIVERRSESTGNHIRRVSRLVQLLVHNIYDNAAVAEEWGLASSLHDVGKIAITDDILHKPGKLTDEEFELIKSHTTIGHELLRRNDGTFFNVASEIALSHHEWWDGSGYPHGIAGIAIPMAARVTAVADVFDALTHARCYKPAWNPDEARDCIARERNTHFDPDVVDALFALQNEVDGILALYPD